METKTKRKKSEKFLNFMKKYGYFIVAGLIVVGITLAVVLTTTTSSPNLNIDDKQEELPPNPIEEVDAKAITFSAPLLDCAVVHKYAADKLIYNSSLGWFETHEGIDLTGSSSDVLAASDGVISEIYTNNLEGTVVVIKHNDIFTTVYGSLSKDLEVSVGDNVTKGQKIGTVSASAGNEVNTGAHLHFELYENDKNINPGDYLNLENK